MTPVLPRSARWHTRISYGLLWGMLLAIVAGLALAVDHTVGLVVVVALGLLLIWRLAQVGVYADGDDVVARTTIGMRRVPVSDIKMFFWRAPKYRAGARLSLRRKDGSELRLPAMVGSPDGGAKVDEALRRWPIPVVPLVEQDYRRDALP